MKIFRKFANNHFSIHHRTFKAFKTRENTAYRPFSLFFAVEVANGVENVRGDGCNDVFGANNDDDEDNDEVITVDFGSPIRGVHGISS